MKTDEEMLRLMRLWDRKLLRLSDELLIYVTQKANLILEKRGEK